MLKSKLILIALCFATASCTGGNNATIQDPGAIKIAPGEVLIVDVQDVIALNVPEFSLSLRSVSADYSTSKVLLDFTSLVASQLQTTTKLKFIIPKNISAVRPLLVVADIPSLNTQLVQVLYDGDASARPGIASLLTYELMKYYPDKPLADYSSSDFHGIQDLIQARTDQLISESENLNLATLPFPKIIRYFKNGIAFNVNFLTQIRQFGVNYTFDLTTPPGLQASDTPELSLTPYQYAVNFKVGGLNAQTNPLNHNNNPPMLTPGASQPNPGTNLFITEGNPVSVSAQGFDIDDDFIDKNMIIQYIPRVLPKSLTTLSTFPVIPEPTPEYTVVTKQTDSVGVDQYTSSVIGFNEALDTAVYPSSLAIDPVLYPAPGALTDTAYRNIYYLVSDGMIRVPYRWNFKYSDTNRQPKIVRDSNGKMNDTYFDNTLAPGELEVAPGTGWKVHGSHCESDPAFSYQTITSKSDGPWSCAFKMIDPDIDDDPNAAADTFNYTLIASDNSSIITTNFAKMWPQYVPPFTAPRFTGTTINNCITPDGKRHYRCGVGLYQVTIDNSVKAAAESKTSQSYNYNVVIYDRPASLGGNSISASLGRTIQLLPQPARLVNYSDPVTPGGTLGLTLVDVPTNTYVRKDTYLSELLNLADPAHALTNLSDIGIGSSGLNSSLAGVANRNAFMAGTSAEITSFASQPHTISGGTVTLDSVTYQATSASPGSLSLFGHSMTTTDVSTYSKPREFDATCSLASNNKGAGWDQDAQGGWTFEIDAIDYDNVALSVGEASDPVHVQLSTDISTTANANGLQYCTYLNPNSDPAYYQTYKATALATAVDAEKCTWSSGVPADMQPIPIYYTVSVAGVPTVKKWVYHRLRFKWQPRDQGMLGKTVADPPFFIKNLISAGLQLSGNRFQLKGDTLDLTTLPAPLNLFANRKDMQPCLAGLTGKFGVVHQISTAPAAPVRFGVSDENKVLWKTPTAPGAVMGRFEAEWKAMGTRSINSPSFLQLVPYMLNCTTRDVDLASTPSSPPATIGGSEPAIWYSQASDASNTPRLRFQTATDPSVLPMCFNYSLNPAKKSGVEYNEVVVIQNTSATPFTLSNSFLSTCTSRASIAISPDQKFIAIASTCGSGHTVGQPALWSDASSSGTVAYVANPTLAANGGLPVGTSLALDLLPSFYQASLAVNFPADFNLPNALFFDASVFDTFRLDPVAGVPTFSGYFQSGAPTWLNNDSTTTLTNALPITPAFPAPGYAFGWQAVDWENQPSYLTIATPTPNPATSNVFFRMAPGDSTRIQVYVKNHATATFPVKVSDVSDILPLEMDPYDIITFGLVPPGSVPSSAPTFTGITRSDCISAPASYPAVSTLNITSLADYKKCSFAWTPTVADDGKKFAYTFTAQDNFGATASVPGVGGRHPAGSGNPGFSLSIPNDGVAKTNGPSVIFNLDIESLEANTSPFFTDAGGANVNYAYNSAGGSAGWTSVYGSNAPAGAQSSCSAPSSGFSCGLTVSNGDTLQSSAAIAMIEGAQQTFTVYAKDSNVTSQLKTLTATPPTRVLIVDGPHQGNTFLVPSFASLPVSTNQNVAAGTANFSFSWTPTDSEANYLSNAGGFLIPMVISDQAYSPASDSGFPTQFTVPAKQSTVWIWAKLSVRNSQPQVFYINGGSEIPLDSAVLSMQTGGTTNVPIRIKDTDIARWIQSNDMTGFSPSYTGPGFTSITSTSAPTLSGNFIIQDFVISGTPLNSDIGTYSSPQVSVTDPGDISLGLAVNPNASPTPSAQVFPTTNTFSVTFSLQVIGKPQFLAPGPTPGPTPGVTPLTYQAYAYASRPFSYPLALSISRQNEMQQPFFMGIDASTAVAPVKRAATGAGSTGIYVSHVSNTVQNNFVVNWPDSTSVDIITTGSPDRIVPIYGVKAAYCNVTDGSAYPAVTLIRYNETSSAIETCKLSANNVATNASSSNLTITLMDNSQLLNPVTSLTLTEANRVFTPSTAPSNLSLALDKQFADFFGRCTNCNVGPTVCDATPSGLALNVTSTGGQTCTEPGTLTARTGFAKYDYNSYSSMFVFDTTPTYSVKKVYRDTLPTTARTTNISASKGEVLHLIATPAVPVDTKYQYRWYVNGCLKASGLLTSALMNYDLKVTTTMGGLNNDCTGAYGYAETGAASLGKLVVKLSLVKGNELLTGTSESSVSSYIWNVTVLNTDPNIITASTYAPANPLSLSSQFTGNRSVQFASTVSYSSKNYFAYTDLSSISGLKVRLTELDSTGNIATGGSNLALNCDSTFNLQPEWMGIQPQASGKLAISVSTNSSYPISGANIAYSAKDQTCFTNTLTTSVPSVSPVVYDSSGSTVPAGYLGFSKYSLSLRALATFANVAPLYQSGINDADYYLIEGKSATSQFWSYNLASIYASNPIEFQAPYANNYVRRNVLSGTNLFQLIGANTSNSTGWRGFILNRTLTPSSNQLLTSGTNRIMFADPAANPPPAATDCKFNGTPLDGIYIPALSGVNVDTLYVLATGSAVGKIVAIQNATGVAGGTPTCVEIGDVKNPSLLNSDHNPNLSKMVYDPVRGTIYGLINPGGGAGGQFYAIDVYSQQLVTRDLSATLSPYELIYSSAINALYLFDNRKSTSPVLSPMLYKIW